MCVIYRHSVMTENSQLGFWLTTSARSPLGQRLLKYIKWEDVMADLESEDKFLKKIVTESIWNTNVWEIDLSCGNSAVGGAEVVSEIMFEW